MIISTFALMVSSLSLFTSGGANFVSEGVDIPNTSYHYRFSCGDVSNIELNDAISISINYTPSQSTTYHEDFLIYYNSTYSDLRVSFNGSQSNFFYRFTFTDGVDIADSGFVYSPLYYDEGLSLLPINEDGGYIDFYLYYFDASMFEENFIGTGDSYDYGYNKGFTDGENVGKQEGKEDYINSQEYQDNIDDAYETGRRTGYNEGLHTQTYTFSQLFGAIADTPILIFRNLLSFGVFGVSAVEIVMTMLTGCIVLYLVKRIIL